MKNSVTKLQAACCSQSHILYRCDLQRSASANIHLGILIELVADDWHALGIAMRTELLQPEIGALAPAWVKRLGNPFEYFQPVYDRAWQEAEPGKCIDWLAEQYCASLLIEPAAQLDLQRIKHDNGCANEEAVRTHVFTMLDTEAKRFLGITRSPAVLIESERAAA